MRVFLFWYHVNTLNQPPDLKHKPVTQQSGRGFEAKKRPVRLRSLAVRRGFVPKGAFLSVSCEHYGSTSKFRAQTHNPAKRLQV